MSKGCNYRQSDFSVKAVDVTATRILAASDDRTALTFSAPDTDIFIGIDASVTITTGFKIAAAVSPFTICQGHGGSFVHRELWAIAVGGLHNLVVLEAFEPINPEGV